jgi:hypothetical protein
VVLGSQAAARTEHRAELVQKFFSSQTICSFRCFVRFLELWGITKSIMIPTILVAYQNSFIKYSKKVL